MPSVGCCLQVTWKECLSNNAAWDTLTWFAALIGMASYLNKYGFIKWFSGKVCPPLPYACATLSCEALHSRSACWICFFSSTEGALCGAYKSHAGHMTACLVTG